VKRPIRFDGKKLIGVTGDDDPLLYGGGVIFRKGELDYWQFWDDRRTDKNYEVWTAKIPSRILKEYRANRYELAEAMGVAPEEVRSLASARDAGDRQRVLKAIIEMRGRTAVCPDGPEDLTTWELCQRWHPVLKVDPETVPRLDEDDYLIMGYEEVMGCGQVGGNFLGAYETLECCAAAIADDLEKTGMRHNVYVADGGSLERLEWNRGRWVGQPKVEVRGAFAPAIWRYRLRPWFRETRKKIRRITRAERKASQQNIRGTLNRFRIH
jgi:hypothetical protein